MFYLGVTGHLQCHIKYLWFECQFITTKCIPYLEYKIVDAMASEIEVSCIGSESCS